MVVDELMDGWAGIATTNPENKNDIEVIRY